MVRDEFALAIRHPEALPLDIGDHSNEVAYRRVRVWRFVFPYRIDADAKLLVIEDIFHERSDRH